MRDRVTERERLNYREQLLPDRDRGFGEGRAGVRVVRADLSAGSRARTPTWATPIGPWDATKRHCLEYREELRLDPDNVRNYTNVAGALINMNRFDEARDVLHQAQQRKLDDELLWINLYSIAFHKHDTEEMHRLVQSAAVKPGLTDVLLGLQSDTEAYFGHLKKARELTARAHDFAHQNEDNETAASYSGHRGPSGK